MGPSTTGGHLWRLRVTSECHGPGEDAAAEPETIAWLVAWTAADEPPRFSSVMDALPSLGIVAKSAGEKLSFNSRTAPLDEKVWDLVSTEPAWSDAHVKLWAFRGLRMPIRDCQA